MNASDATSRPPALLEGLLEQAAALHHHLCPRQVLGVRMGMLAAELLGITLPQQDKRLLAIVETDGCFSDGVAVATNCWVGRRTLRVVDYGKVAATFVDTHLGAAWRIAPHPEARTRAGRYAPQARSTWQAMLVGYQRMPAVELLVWRPVRLAVPVSEIVSRPGLRAFCARCGEEIVNGRERIVDSVSLCRACAGEDYLQPG